ncbi:N-acetyltransferase [Celerinatantimonas diazotrophica]|uniref:Putative acetyltransferase n=1 Tax=Celerinatantimonas diazotrophica TaxID=412034 RepID=A0A4R1JLA0_9GAMM|nr:N-acetyltransferase [Celerinatantimonas diazotrophica]TCK51825.1 putative acetyltransferase [Celerinatantimonas diazotrophica]CAG9296483.1 Peptidyl-lysine N-acetyltransferase YiaC [Celerinatantimonas diazotrophica]
MIRAYDEDDIEAVLQIWLSTSILAHCFIPADFWISQVENMRNVYIPASENYVFVIDSEIVGFSSLYENNLAALFVVPHRQGKGIGKQLLNHAKHRRATLTLSVYKENQASYQFYLSQGFNVLREQTDVNTGHPEYVMNCGGGNSSETLV